MVWGTRALRGPPLVLPQPSHRDCTATSPARLRPTAQDLAVGPYRPSRPTRRGEEEAEENEEEDEEEEEHAGEGADEEEAEADAHMHMPVQSLLGRVDPAGPAFGFAQCAPAAGRLVDGAGGHEGLPLVALPDVPGAAGRPGGRADGGAGVCV